MTDDTAVTSQRTARARPTGLLGTARRKAAASFTALATSLTIVGFAQVNEWVPLWTPDGPKDTGSAGGTTSDPSSAPPTTPPSGEATTGPPAGPDPSPEQRRLLAELQPVAGAPHLVPLQGGATAATSLGVPCGAGTSTDQYREVRYRLAREYDAFEAEVVTSGVEDPEAAIQVDVLSGRQVVGRVVLQGNGTTDLDADLSPDLEVAVRVVCQRPGGLVVLRNPAVTRAS